MTNIINASFCDVFEKHAILINRMTSNQCTFSMKLIEVKLLYFFRNYNNKFHLDEIPSARPFHNGNEFADENDIKFMHW